MRLYVVVTGILFALVTLAHIARMIFEDANLASDPFYLLVTLSAAALSAWSGFLVRRSATGRRT